MHGPFITDEHGNRMCLHCHERVFHGPCMPPAGRTRYGACRCKNCLRVRRVRAWQLDIAEGAPFKNLRTYNERAYL